MSGQTQTVNVQVNATGNFSNLTSEANKFKSVLQGIKLPNNIGEKLEKSLGSLESKYSKFQSLANKGINTKSDFSKLNASAREVEREITHIEKIMSSVSNRDIKIAAFDTSEVKKARVEAEKYLKLSEKFTNVGTSKGQGSFSESEVARVEKLIGSSKGLKDRFQGVVSALKTGDIDKVNAAMEKLNHHLDVYGKKMSAGKASGVSGWISSVNSELSGFTAKATEAKNKMDQVVNSKVQNLQNVFNNAASGINNMNNGLRQTIAAETEAASRANQLNEQVGHLRTQANYFFGLQNMGRLIARGIREAAESVRDLDKAMTETAVVTDYSVGDMWGMLPEYTKLANKLGATTQGAYETMTLYFQQGLDKNATFEIGEETMKMARIAGLDYAETTNMMTAALRGFNMELNHTSAQKVNDVYSKLAAITASDTRELGLAMERTASIAHSANMDFGNTTAFLAQMIETTREAPENLGTAMKTIIARFQELKENPYSISEVEGEEVNFNRVDKALKSIGVDLMDNRDKFRDLDDVFMDISSKWDGLSQTQQRYVATIAAGARQQSRFLAMVQNYDRLKQLTDAAANSEGASQVQFNKTLESYEAKVNKLKNAWQAFTMSLANNRAVKGGVEILQRIITFGNKIIQVFGKAGSIFGDFGKGIAEMGAAFGLGALGFKGLKSGANFGLGMLGKMTIGKEMSAGNMFVNTQANRSNNLMAAKITNPIVSAIDRLSGAILGEGNTNNSIYKDTKTQSDLLFEKRQNLMSLMQHTTDANGKKQVPTFTHRDVISQLGDLSAVEQQIIQSTTPVLNRALDASFKNGLKNLKLTKPAHEAALRWGQSIEKEFRRGDLSYADKLAKKMDIALMGEQIGGPLGEEILKSAAESSGKYKGAKYTEKFRRQALRAVAEGKIKENEIDNFINAKRARSAANDPNIGFGGVPAKIGALDDKMLSFSKSTMQAGQAVMGLGMTLQAAGFETAGTIFMTMGNGLVGLGMAADGAVKAVQNIGKAFKFLKSNPWLLIAAGAIAATAAIVGLNKKIVKNTRKTGKDVVDEYTKTTDKTTKQLSKFKEYQENWGRWSQGVDENGYNIGLENSDYEDYLKAVKEITKAHPELIKGYNGLGNAIINNNSALQDSIRLTTKEQKQAEKTYLESGNQILARQKTLKRWQASQPKNVNGRASQTLGYTEPSKMKTEANAVAKAIEKLDGGKDLLEQYNVTLNEMGQITDEGLESLRTRGADLLSSASEMSGVDEDLLTDAQNKMATFGQTIKGLEDATKDYYDWGWTYASSKGYNQIESNLLIPFQTGIQRLAEKGLSQGRFEKEIDNLAAAYTDLGGHAEDFRKIQDKVTQAQKDFSKTGNIDEYTKSVTESTKALDGWIDNLKAKGGEANKLLAEFFESYKRNSLNISESFPTFDEAINSWSGDIESANKAYDNWSKSIESGDYYTAREGFKKMYEEVNDGIDDLGNKSQSWWKAARTMMGDDYILNHSAETIENHMKNIKRYFEEGEDGVANFMTDIKSKIQNDKGFQELFGDYIKVNKNGGLDFNFDDLNDEKLKAMADSLGLSKDAMVALFNAARQFGDLDFNNVDDIKSAMVAEGAPVGEKGGVYFSQEDFLLRAMEANGGDKGKAETALLKFIEAGNTAIKKDKKGNVQLTKKDLSGFIKDWDIRKDTKGDKNLTDSFSLISKLAGTNLNKDDIKGVYESNKDLLTDYKEGGFESFWQDYQAVENPLLSPVTSIQGTAEGILSAVNALALDRGILTESGKQEVKTGINEAKDFVNEGTRGYESYDDYNSKREEYKSNLEKLDFSLEQAQQYHDKNSSAYKELEDQRNKIKKVLDEIDKTAQTEKEFANQKEKEKYADWADKKIETDDKGNIDLSELLSVNPEKLSGISKQLQTSLQQAFSEDGSQTGAGILDRALRLSRVNAQLEQTGEVGKQSADKLRNAFIQANSEGISKMNVKQLDGLANSLGITREELQQIAKEYNIDLKIPDEPEKKVEDTQSKVDELTQSPHELQLAASIIDAPGARSLVDKTTGFFKGLFGGDGSTTTETIDVTLAPNVINKDATTTTLNTVVPSNPAPLTQTQAINITLIPGILNAEAPANTINSTISNTPAPKNVTQAINITLIPGILNAEAPANTINSTVPNVLSTKNVTQPVEITLNPTIKNPNATDEKTNKIGKDNKGQTQTNTITLNTIITNPDEPKAKMDAALPKNYQATVRASIIMNASVNASGLRGKMQQSANNASKGLKVKANTTSTIATKIDNTAQRQINDIKRNSAVTIKTKADNAAQRAINAIKGKSVSVNISPTFSGNWTKTATVYVNTVKHHTGGLVVPGGPIYRARGGLASNPIFKREGTDTIPAMLTPGEYVHNRKAVQYFGVDFMRRINHKDLIGALQSFGSMANGRYGRLGPKDKGGLTLTGEEGFEIAWLPSENRSMILGTNGPQMVDLPKDAVVWTNEESKKIIKQKAIPAQSAKRGLTGTYNFNNSGGENSSSYSPPRKNSPKKSSPKKSGNSDEKNTKATAKNIKAIKHIIQTAGKINYWWWNYTQKVESTQRRIDKLLKKLEKSFSRVGTTTKTVQASISKYSSLLKQQINLNTTMYNQAKKNLKAGAGGSSKSVYNNVKKAQKSVNKAQTDYNNARNKAESLDAKYYKLSSKKQKSKSGKRLKARLTAARKEEKNALKALRTAEKNRDKKKIGANWANISYEVTTQKREKGKVTKSKETKKEKIDLAPFISYDPKTQAYQVDYAKINKTIGATNGAKAKAVGEAAKKFIEDNVKRRNDAQDKIEGAREALEKLSDDIYETFYRWEKSITKVYLLSAKLEELSSRLDIANSKYELQVAKQEAGVSGSGLSLGLERITSALAQERNIMFNQVRGNKALLQSSKTEYTNSLDFSTYLSKYLKSSNSPNAKDDFKAASMTFNLLKKANLTGNNFDYTAAIKALRNERYNEATEEAIKKVLDNIFEKQTNYLNSINETYSSITAIYNKIEELQSSIADFEDGLLEGLEEQAEDELKKLEDLNSSLSKAFKDLIDEVRDKLEERRKKEDNQKTELDISRKQQRLSALKADTSGGYQVEIAQLEKEITDAQQSYQRTLEDQLLDRLQKQGDKAEKQRERQIELLTTQNEIAKISGSNLKEVNDWLKNPTKNKEQIKQAWLKNQNYDEATANGRRQLEQDFESEWTQYLANRSQLPIYQKQALGILKGQKDSLLKIENSIDKIAKNIKISGDRTAKTMRSKGYTAKQLKTAGYKASSLKTGGYAIGSIVKSGYKEADLRKAGITPSAIKKYNKATKKNKVTAKDMKNAGFSAKEAKQAGFTNQQIRKSGYTASQFKGTGQSAAAAKKAGYNNKSIAKAYGSTAAMTTLNMSGKTTQAITGASLKTLQKVVNKSSKDKATQFDLAGVKASIDINGSKKGGKVSGTVNASGRTISANRGSALYAQAINTKTGNPTGKISRITIDKLQPKHFKYNKKEATEALVYAITHQTWGSKINKNFKNLVKAAGIAGKQYKLSGKGHNWTASIGSNGLIYQNTANHTGVGRWNPATGKTDFIKYNKSKFLKYAKANSTVSREFAQVLINRKVYTKKQLQKYGVKKFATGGLATQTGPAWLDGTPSKPELVLNAQDTKNFLGLKDVLSHAMSSTNSAPASYGDTNIEVNVNVDHIDSDYDVDRLVQRVKKDIAKDAGYRNVTQVRKLR